MAEDEDGALNKNSPQNSNNAGSSQDNEHNTNKPDLGIEEAKYDSNENGDNLPPEPKSSTSKSTGAVRKEENPFSFRHFLKRDLSLPGNSTYENTGARPKVYSNTVQHSPTKTDLHPEPRRERARVQLSDPQAKETNHKGSTHRISEITPSSSSVEIPFSVVDDSDSKHNLYAASSDVPFYQRPNLASEPLGMPSLPDFVQDHILVEQAYLNSNGPISVDLDNLPDFTFNTNFHTGSIGRRNISGFGGSGRSYDYDVFGEASSSSGGFHGAGAERNIPLDLPAGAEAVGPVVDPPPHLSLDLTESVNPADRRNVSPRNNFPLDLPPNAGAESMRLPDFLPVHPGRTSPQPEQDGELQRLERELQQARSELFAERTRRTRVETELRDARESASLLRAEAAAARAAEASARVRLAGAGGVAGGVAGGGAGAGSVAGGGTGVHIQGAGLADAATARAETNPQDGTAKATDAEGTIAKLRKEIKSLKEELAASEAENRRLRGLQSNAATDLRIATTVAESSLRDLLSGLERLRSLSSTLDSA